MCDYMKKKIWWITIVVIGSVLLLLVIFCGIMINRGYGISQGRYLEGKDGQPLLILNNSPIEMSNRTGRNLFDGLDTGDEILVIHDGIAESYPGQTCTYIVFKLRDGSSTDIPKTVIDPLIELGWLEVAVAE